MGLFDRLFGRREEPRAQPAASSYDPGREESRSADADELALRRYRYMLNTAPPETIEQAHEEAFAKLTPNQRAQVLRELAAQTPEREKSLAEGRDDPRTLARMATRAEMRQPGTMERTFGGMSRGPGMGGMMGGMGGTILGSLAAGFVGSMVAQQFLDNVGDIGFGDVDPSGQLGTEETADSTGYDTGDSGSDYDYSDYGSGDYGGDFGGGDFGGGDFGDF